MADIPEANGAAPTLGGTAFARAVLAGCERMVAPSVHEAEERGRQAAVLGALVGVALAAVLSSPILWLAGLALPVAAAPTILAGLVLGLAGALATHGRLDQAAMSGAVLVAGLAGLVAAASSGLSSPALWLVAIAPIEALLARRRTMAAFGAGVAALTIGAVALAQWTGVAEVPAGRALSIDVTATVAGIVYAARLGLHAVLALRASTALRKRQGTDAAFVEAALGVGVLRFAPDGSLVSASDVAGVLFPGVSSLSATGIAAAIHVTDRVRYLQAFADLRNGAAVMTVDVRTAAVGQAEAGFVDMRFDLQAIRGPSGRLVSIVALARRVDGTMAEPGRLERALAEEQANSKAKSRFLATVSHELRTPLNAIIGFSDVLDQEFFGGFADPRQKEYVGLIRQSGEHLLGVVNTLLDLSKIEAGRHELEPEGLRLEDLFAAAGETMRPQVERKGLSLSIAIDPGATSLVADRRACHQILLNLLANAAKFTERGGVTLSARRAGVMIEIAVSDTGIGIAADDLPRLGQPFTQISSGPARHYPGTGLGLSLVKGLAELHGGRMAIESQHGAGTTVRVSLPLDGPGRIDPHPPQTETVVALAHARKKPNQRPQDARTRRSA